MDQLYTYLDLLTHFIFSIGVAFFVWKKFGKNNKKTLLICLAVSLLGGIFIDIDHLFDYFLVYGFKFDYSKFITGRSFTTGVNYILFHGFEYSAISGFLAAKTNGLKKTIFTTLAFTLFFHYLVDSVLYSIPIKQYFITFRILNGFKTLGYPDGGFLQFNFKQILGL